MRHHRVPRLATWLFARLLPQADREAVLGDLVEEYGIRARSASTASATKWYWGQVGRSIPAVLWVAVRRGAWLSTVGVAIGAYVFVGMIEFAGMAAISRLLGPDAHGPSVLRAIVGLLTIAVGGYFAASIRERAATVLAWIVVISVLILMVTMSDSAPYWYGLTFLFIGPVAASAGGSLWLSRRRRRARAGVQRGKTRCEGPSAKGHLS